MKRASRLFTKEERRAVEAAVADAESVTSGEIVPVVATVSGRYDRAEDLFGVIVALVGVAAAWLLFQGVRPVEGDWAQGQLILLGLLPILLIALFGFALGAALASWFPVLRLPFLTRREMLEEVDRGAREAFHRFHVRRTAGNTGILIYVSLYEHMVRVIGDDAISERIKQSDWEEIGDLVIEGIRAHTPAKGLIKAIRMSGELLSQHAPIEPGDVNELTNELRLID